MGRAGDLVVLALSGGADSTCLLDILDRLKDELGIALAVAHFEHGLRGEAGQGDAEFARDLAQQRSLKFIIGHGDVPKIARRERMSTEEAARRARYEFFESLIAQFPDLHPDSIKIALAHTANDQAETVLMRLLRGSGPRGLGGIPPVRGRYIRPLIETSRDDIIEYLKSRNLSWREDETNVSSDFLRNRVRSELLPELIRNYNPNLVETLVRTAKACRENSDFLGNEAQRLLSASAGMSHEQPLLIPRKLLRDEHPALALALIEAAIKKVSGTLWAVRSEHRHAIIEAAGSAGTGTITLPHRIEVWVGPEWVRIGKPLPPVGDICVPLLLPGSTRIDSLDVTIETEILDRRSRRITASSLKGTHPNVAFLDMDSLKEPLEVRNFRPGDRIQPLGMTGMRKLQDLFVDLKVTRQLRRRVPIVTSGGQIAWVASFRIAHPFRVTAQTRKILQITLTQGA